MRSVLKSSLFRNSIYQKEYSKDFLADELIENKIDIDADSVSGTIRETQLDGIFVVNKDINAPNGYSFEVSNNFSVFVLHFEIAGNYCYTPKGGEQPLLEIGGFEYNMFYLPRTNGILEYKGNPRRTLEIIFTQGLIKKLIGENYAQVLERIGTAVEKGEPIVFWKRPCPISPELSRVLEAIISCPFDGRLKKTYLQSRITTLLLDILIQANAKHSPVPKIDMPNADMNSLRVVEHHIKANLNTSLCISQLTVVAGFNASKLKREFKRAYGTTIFKYITQLRMETASDLIVNRGLTIAQAAHEVGYSNPQHFTNAFKRTMGYLPSALKN